MKEALKKGFFVWTIWIIIVLIIAVKTNALADKSNYNFFDDGGDTYAINGSAAVPADLVTKYGWTCNLNNPFYNYSGTGGGQTIVGYSGMSIIEPKNSECRPPAGKTGIDQTFSWKVARIGTSSDFLFRGVGGDFTVYGALYGNDGTWRWYDSGGTYRSLPQPSIVAGQWYEFAVEQTARATTVYYKNTSTNQWDLQWNDTSETARLIAHPFWFQGASSNTVVGIDDMVSWNGTILDEPQTIIPVGDNTTVTGLVPATANITNVDVNFTFNITGAGADSCSLYGNWSGVWAINKTRTDVGLIGFYDWGKVGMGNTHGTYLWSVACTNNSVGATFWGTNNTITIDRIFPTITLNPNNEWNSNNLSVGNPYDDQIQINISFRDERDLYKAVVQISKDGVYLFNYTDIVTGNVTYTFANLTNISKWDIGNYVAMASISDSHTALAIKDYTVKKLNSKLEFYTEERNYIWIETDDPATTNAVKSYDRYSTEFTFTDGLKKGRTFNVKSNTKIDYLPNSKYKAHFIISKDDSVEGNWLDFEGEEGIPTVTKISDYHYKVVFNELDTKVKFNSVGSLNTYIQYYTFYRGNYSVLAPTGYVGESSTLYLNVSNGTGIANINSTLVYNLVNYSGIDKTVYETTFAFDRDITNSAVANYSYYWVITATQSDGITWTFNTSYTEHMVVDWSLDTCGTNTNQAIVFNNWIENYITTQQNVSWEIDSEYWLTSKSNSKNYSTALLNSQNLSLCISKNMFADIYIQYKADDGFTHRWLLYNKSLVTTATIDQKIYNFNTTTGISTLRITARDQDSFDYYKDAVTTLQHFYPSLNEWRDVQMGKSDDYGFIFFNVLEKGTDYRLVFRDLNNNLLKLTETLTFSCDSSVCTLLALLRPYSVSAGTRNVSVSYNYNNDTGILTVNWISGLDVQLSSIVTHETGKGTTVLCNYYTSSTMAGSTTCNLSGYSGAAWLKVNSTYSGVEVFNFGTLITLASRKLDSYINQREGAFYAFAIMALVIGFGIWSPVAVIISAMFGLIIIYFLGIVSAVTLTFLSIAIILGVVLAIKLKS